MILSTANWTQRTRVHIIANAILFSMFMTVSLKAQSDHDVFHTLNIGLNLVVNTNRNIFHQYWQPNTGFELYIGSPFYYGNIQIGFHYLPFSGKRIQQTSFNSLYFYLHWEKEWNFLRSLHCSIGGRIGFFQMYFDREFPDIDEQLVKEQEFATGLCSSLCYSLSSKWRIYVNGVFLKIYTYKEIRHTYFSIGIRWTFHTPKWLRNFLK